MLETLRGGRYVVHGTLGGGAQAITLDAVDKVEGRAVAIKRFDVRGARAWKDVELAEREARVLASLSHPRLPSYVEHFEEDGALYLVMEKIEGESLGSMMRRGMHLDEADIDRLLRDAAEILDYLHSRVPPIIHRDLKPGNVIRRPNGEYAFVDFGSVRDRLRPEGGSTVVGTFGFMAPEQFQGRALPGSDVYAIGATCVAMLTGTPPEELPHRGLAIDVQSALAGRDARLVSLLTSMLDPDPDRRPTRITPLLQPPKASSTAYDAREIPRVSVKDVRKAARASRKELRHLEKAAKEAARRLAKEARAYRTRPDWEHHARRDRIPVLPGLIVSMALSITVVVLAVVLRAFVPVLLTFLSLFFGRGLIVAARATSAAGERAIRKVEAVRRLVHGNMESRDDRADESATVHASSVRVEQVRTSVRVEQSGGVRVDPSVASRVESPDVPEDIDDVRVTGGRRR